MKKLYKQIELYKNKSEMDDGCVTFCKNEWATDNLLIVSKINVSDCSFN